MLQRAAQSQRGIPYPLIVVWMNAQTNLATCMMRQERFDDARKLLEGAVGIAENAIEQIPALSETLLNVARTKMHLGRIDGIAGTPEAGVAIAEELSGGSDTIDCYYAARVYAVCAPRTKNASLYRGLALQLLSDCCSAGYFATQSQLDELRQEPDFSSLRGTDEFEELIQLSQSRLKAP
jgi:hypothetical protein